MKDKGKDYIETGSGTACMPVSRLIAVAEIPACECGFWYEGTCSNCEMLVSAAPKLAAALKIAIEALKKAHEKACHRRGLDDEVKIHCENGLDAINEVCK